jgi:uncharacterized protein
MPRFLRNSRKERQAPDDAFTLYYASDLHGAVRCWRKFLGAGKFYGADALVMGGDLAGKAIVPIELAGDGRFSAEFLGESYRGSRESELSELEDAIRYNGFYPYAAEASELDRYRNDAAALDDLFQRLVVEEARRWIDLADERISENQIPVYVVAGNDDPWALDAVLDGAERVISAEDEIAMVGEHEMISCSFANPTPWNSPRELSEDDLYARLKKQASAVTDPERAIFNLHVPPYDTGLDNAALVNDDLTYVTHGGEPVEGPVGSHAVRQIIEEYQPMLALHGHIHESRGVVRIGRTLCINPGSEYNSGRIHGVLVTLGHDEVKRHQFVVG